MASDPDNPSHGNSVGASVSADDHDIFGPGNAAAGTDIFFTAIRMSRMPMCLTDPHLPDGPIIFCNRAFELLTGYSQEEVLGRNCRFLQGEGTDPAAIEEMRRALRMQEDVQLEVLNYRKDGSSFWNALFLSPVVDPDGRLLYHFGSQIDVSRRREAEAAMLQTQRLDTLGSMASSLAHEFKNLMTIVLANLERLETEPDAGRRAKQVERATWGAQRATRLTDQMLSFARRQFRDDRRTDVNQTLAGCDAILDQMAGPGLQVRLDLAAGPLLASVDASQLEMALLNLVRNAADAAPARSEIVVSTRSRFNEDANGRPMLEIAVTDTGIGMSPEIAARALEPFFTTKALGKGTGLGLSMVKGFVEQSNGSLELETAPGVGTTIRLVFPMLRAPDEARCQAS